MATTTVGELIDTLQHYSRDLPVLKADNMGVGYTPVAAIGNLLFAVEPHGPGDPDPAEITPPYVDANVPTHPNAFMAVVI